MLNFIAASAMLALAPPNADLEAVPFTQVQIQDHFWTPRQEVNSKVSVDHCLEMLEKAGNLHNFELAAQGAHSGYRGYVFNDSDVYKVLEGASYTLATNPNPDLDRRLDKILELIAKAQLPDGYVDTYYEINGIDKRLTNLEDNHELYCAGHLMEAAVAHFQATGKKNFLNVATKYANFLFKTFGPNGEREGYGGHPELELALVKLSKATGDARYFELSRKLVESRGTHFFAKEHHIAGGDYDGTYYLDDVPLKDQRQIKGHAVRAAYLMSGATDVVRQDDDEAMEKALDRVWNNAVNKRIFVTGGIGPSGSNEGFTVDYDLPNQTAYQETCASIAMAMWGYRMGMLHGDGKYFDAVENSLYNATLAGVSADGKKFFYVNPLASTGNHHRQPWFDCACCPPNALRTIAAVGSYAYAQKNQDLYVNLYVPGKASFKIAGNKVDLQVRGNYPWDGRLSLRVGTAKALAMGLHLRIPGWCAGAKLTIDGTPVTATANHYFVVDRTWHDGDEISLELPMPVERISANPQVKEDVGREAVRRGPLIYCAEAIDQRVAIDNLVLPQDAALTPRMDRGLLGGVVALEGEAKAQPEQDWDGSLYQAAAPLQSAPIKLIPYCDWDNRQPGAMEVWFPIAPAPAKVGGAEIKAKVAVSYLSGNAQLEGINDGSDPKSSGEATNRLMHWWPHKGTAEWVSYTWSKPISIQGIKIYWFDDTGRGECRLPESWSLERKEGDKWVPVDAKSLPVDLDKWDEIDFSPITTTALRLNVKLKPGWAAGVRQWKVIEAD